MKINQIYSYRVVNSVMQKTKWRWYIIPDLFFHPGEVNGIAVQASRGSGLQAAKLEPGFV